MMNTVQPAGSASSHQPVAPFRVTTERNGRKTAWLSLFGQLDLRPLGCWRVSS